MRIWLITIGEPVPVSSDGADRLHRTGLFAGLLAHNGHDVAWWTSTFDHFRKNHCCEHDQTISLDGSIDIIMLYGGGYKTNVSLSRIRDQRRIAGKFAVMAPNHPRPDIILCSYPTIELCLAAVRFGKKHKVPVVLDMRDMWPDIFTDHVPRMFRPAAKLAAAHMYRAASDACAGATAITGITEAFVDWGLAKGRRKRSPWDMAFPMGYASRSPTEGQVREAESFWDGFGIYQDKKDFVGCFIGTMGRQFDLDLVVSAVRKIHHSGRRLRFVFCGTGDRLDYFRKLAADLPNALFPGWVDAAKIFVLMRRSAIGFDPLPDRYDFLATINNKAIEYMSAGLPIISSPCKGILYDLLNTYGCGISYPVGDVDALAERLIKCYDDGEGLKKMAQNALTLFRDRFTAEKVYREMMDHLVEIAKEYKKVPDRR
jgi:glycosyltransferase involved in cell wall biosynthesis